MKKYKKMFLAVTLSVLICAYYAVSSFAAGGTPATVLCEFAVKAVQAHGEELVLR